MDVRLLMAMPVLTVLVAGCSGPDGLLTADEAIARALALSPGATLVDVHGVEGPQLHVEHARLAFRDDGLDDGAFGDGRLSSWVVGLRLNDSLVERRIFGDGRPPAFFEGDVPEVFMDMDIRIPLKRHLDSPEATAAAFAACDLMPAAGTPTGYLYAFSLYSSTVSPPNLRVSRVLGIEVTPIESLGFARTADTWSVTRVDLTPGSDHVATTARLIGEDLKPSCRTTLPLQATQVFWASDFWIESLAKPDVPALYPYSFEVGERAVHVRGAFWVQGHDQTPPGMHAPVRVATPPVGRLTMADGSVLFEGDAWYRVDVEVERGKIVPGSWHLEARTDGPVGQRMHVGGELIALERLLP